MSTVIQIRPARMADDMDAIVEFQVLMALETEALALDRATVQRGVSAVFEHAEKGQYYVAEADGRLAASLLTVPEWSDWRNGTVLWIHSVYVAGEFRRRGIFRSMYDHLRQRVESDANLEGLRLYVHRDNQIAQRTYGELGMDGEYYRLFEWMK